MTLDEVRTPTHQNYILVANVVFFIQKHLLLTVIISSILYSETFIINIYAHLLHNFRDSFTLLSKTSVVLSSTLKTFVLPRLFNAIILESSMSRARKSCIQVDINVDIKRF